MLTYPVLSVPYNQDSLNSLILSDSQVNPEGNDAQIRIYFVNTAIFFPIFLF